MSIESVRCQIVLNGKDLAKTRGLDPSRVNCPVEHVCNGSSCIFVPESLPNRKKIPDVSHIARIGVKKAAILPVN